MKNAFSPLIVAACLLAATPPGAVAAAKSCPELERQRDKVHTQLRRGHSADQGNRLRARLRELDSRIAHDCR